MSANPTRRWILLAVLLGAFATGSRLAAEIEVSLAVVGAGVADEPTEIALVAEPVGGGAAAAVEYAVRLGLSKLDLPAAGGWRLRAQAPGYWGNVVAVDRVAAGETVELRLWRAGVLRGALLAAGRETLPLEVDLDFEADDHTWGVGDAPPAATVRCPVVGEVWRCEVPTGSLNLTLAAGLFVRHHRWEVMVEPGQVRDLGTFELELGGAIGGRVELEGGGVPSPECEVRLASRRQENPQPADPLVARVAEDGSFELRGVPAREYVLTASQPEYLAVTSDPVGIPPGETVAITEPLVLRRPAALELVFSPQLAPGGRGWRFLVRKLGEGGEPAVQATPGVSGADGTWIRENLIPGRYEILVSEKLGPQLAPLEVEVPSGQTTTVQVELPIVLLEGTVLLGDEPLAARVTLSRPEDNLRATFESDATGAFSGLLPRDGLWQVRVDAPTERISTALDPIEVSASGVGRVAAVEIRLPGTVLEGEVTDLWGNPQSEARVQIQRRGVEAGSHSVKTDAGGRFSFRGLAPGSISVMAQAGPLRSQWFQMVLYEGHPVPPLQLVVK